MSTPVVGFFNNKGGVGKTSLVYHLAWIYAELNRRVVVADLDPQANLTAAFLTEEEIEDLWTPSPRPTIYGAIEPLIDGTGPVSPLPPKMVNDMIALIPGDLDLSLFEAELSDAWPRAMDGQRRAFAVLNAFSTVISHAVQKTGADLALVDVGPNLGALNRAALINCSHIVIPLIPDLFSLRGLQNLGPTIRRWRQEWHQRLNQHPDSVVTAPAGDMQPVGYVMFQHRERVGRPTRAYARWASRIPEMYGRHVLDDKGPFIDNIDDDPHCLARLRHYQSLMPMAQEARKPVFLLKPADGAFGGHLAAALDAYRDFERLAKALAARVNLPD